MPSASPRQRPWYRLPLLRAAVLVTCLALVGGAVAGCETTQEKAAKQQARAAHILEARAERQQAKKKRKQHAKAKQHRQKGKNE